MKIRFRDFGRCLICLHNPCDCKKKENNIRTDAYKQFEKDIKDGKIKKKDIDF